MVESNAQIYADHRPRYPQKLIDDLRNRTVGDRGQQLIDWGCGTGELTLPLSPYFERVVAVDIGAEQIAIGQDGARRKGIENIEWHVDRAENLEVRSESCDLIISASAFHLMDRELLSERAFRGLKGNGALVLVGGAGANVWSGSAEWHRVASDCLTKYIDEPKRSEPRPERKPTKTEAPKKWNGDFLESAGFRIEHFQYPTEFSWPVDQVAGYMYSITGGLPWRLGDKRALFERKFTESLTRQNPSGVIHEMIDFFLVIGRKS